MRSGRTAAAVSSLRNVGPVVETGAIGHGVDHGPRSRNVMRKGRRDRPFPAGCRQRDRAGSWPWRGSARGSGRDAAGSRFSRWLMSGDRAADDFAPGVGRELHRAGDLEVGDRRRLGPEPVARDRKRHLCEGGAGQDRASVDIVVGEVWMGTSCRGSSATRTDRRRSVRRSEGARRSASWSTSSRSSRPAGRSCAVHG